MKLFFINGPDVGKTFEPTSDIIRVGREVDNDIEILAGGLSRYHAVFNKVDGFWNVADLGSTNGTKINGTPVGLDPVKVHHNDLCTLGDQVLRITLEENENPPKTKTKKEPVIPEKNDIKESVEPPVQLLNLGETKEETPIVSILNLADEKKEESKPVEPPPAVVISPQTPHTPPPASNPQELDINKLRESGIFADHTAEAPENNENGEEPKKKSNILMFSLMGVLAIMIIGLIIALNAKLSTEHKTNIHTAQTKDPNDQPLTIYYERQEEIENANVFRIQFIIEQGVVSSVKIVDLASHYSPSMRVALETQDTQIATDGVWSLRKNELERLERTIKSSNFMNAKFPERQHSNAVNYCHLSICQGRNLRTFSEYDDINAMPREITAIQAAIEVFIEEVYGLSVTTSPTKIAENAENDYRIAKEAALNRSSNPKKYNEAILRLERSVAKVKDFRTKPAWFNEARDLLDQIRTERKEKIQELKNNANLYWSQNMYKEAYKVQEELVRYLNTSSLNDDDIAELKKARAALSKIQEAIRISQGA